MYYLKAENRPRKMCRFENLKIKMFSKLKLSGLWTVIRNFVFQISHAAPLSLPL